MTVVMLTQLQEHDKNSRYIHSRNSNSTATIATMRKTSIVLELVVVIPGEIKGSSTLKAPSVLSN